MKITLQLNYWNLGFWWCSKSPIWSSNFTASFHHFSYKERPDLQKINLFTLLQYFSQKIPSSTVTLFPAPLKSKAVQGSQFRKANIARVTECHCTNTSLNTIPLIYKAWVLNQKTALFLNASYLFFFFFNCDSLHARLNSQYEACSYKKKSTKKITAYRKSV